MSSRSTHGPARERPARRDFMRSAAALGVSLALPSPITANLGRLEKPVKLGLIADLHHDVMHDGPERLAAFRKAMQDDRPDAIVQLGDFAYPSAANRPLTDAFRKSHPRALHVLGNHDIDGGHSFEQVAGLWGMKGRYYTESIGGLQLLVLDGNEKPPQHRGGYPAHIGPRQLDWLRSERARLDAPVVVFSHQPLAGPSCIDNAEEVQKVLNAAADKVLLSVNGHTHIDHLVRAGKIINLHVNSASYYWVGGSHRHRSYPEEVHSSHPYIEYTCPYDRSLFTTLTIDPAGGRIHLKGSEARWVGKSPAQLGLDSHPDLTDGEEICPRIRDRRLLRPPV